MLCYFRIWRTRFWNSFIKKISKNIYLVIYLAIYLAIENYQSTVSLHRDCLAMVLALLLPKVFTNWFIVTRVLGRTMFLQSPLLLFREGNFTVGPKFKSPWKKAALLQSATDFYNFKASLFVTCFFMYLG